MRRIGIYIELLEELHVLIGKGAETVQGAFEGELPGTTVHETWKWNMAPKLGRRFSSNY